MVQLLVVSQSKNGLEVALSGGFEGDVAVANEGLHNGLSSQ